jgi:hypothetical protein
MFRRRYKAAAVALAIALLLAFAAMIGTIGCGAGSAVTTTAAGSYMTAAASATTAGPATTVGRGEEAGGTASPSYDYAASGNTGSDQSLGGTLVALEVSSSQKVIGDAQLEIEVEAGKFQMVFSEALLLADRYAGYLMSSNSAASSDDGSMKTGTVTIRVPSNFFSKALSDASQLGTLKNQTLSTQDVTEEYVDLQARIKNSEAHVSSLVALLAQAKTIDQILQVEGVVNAAQQDLEQLKGRLRFLDEHTSYSTITMNIYEKGTEPVVEVASTWGVGGAFKDALHYLVRVFNGIVRGLGVLIPVLIVVAIVGYIAYRIIRSVTRSDRQKQQAAHQPLPQGSPLTQGWHATAAGPVSGAPPTSGTPGEDAGQGGEAKK